MYKIRIVDKRNSGLPLEPDYKWFQRYVDRDGNPVKYWQASFWNYYISIQG